MLAEMFQKPKPILGTVQLLPLPGSPGWNGRLEALVVRAEQEATALASGGVDGILLENFHDSPHRPGRVDAAAAIAMALIAKRIMQLTDVPLGISVLQNDPETALAIAANVGASFIRVPVLVGAAITESGLSEGRLNALVEYRNFLKPPTPVKIFADISLNHLTPGTVSAAVRNLQAAEPRVEILSKVLQVTARQSFADALILTDPEPGLEEWEAVKRHSPLPLFATDRVLPGRLPESYDLFDGVILSDTIKKSPIQGLDPRTSVDLTKVEAWMARLEALRPSALPRPLALEQPN